MSGRTVILGYARTPFGRLMGGLGTLSAPELGGHAIAAAIARSSVPATDIQHVIMGHVLQAGVGQITARQAAVAAGLDLSVTAETINKVCASGLKAVSYADLLIRSGVHDVVVAGGMESMSNAPHVAHGLRGGCKMGDITLVDAMIHDGLTDPFNGKHMVVNASDVANELQISREEQDRWAVRSHERAIASRDFLAGEIEPVTIASRKGDVTVDVDESPRADTTFERLSSLRPVMTSSGSTTAGNAPGINDGAAAIVLAGEEWAASRGLTPLGYIGAAAYVAGESPYLARMPGLAINALLEAQSMAIGDIDLIEINEAFASVALHSIDLIKADPERVNVHGGAIAMGHPLGASGARVIGTLARALVERGGRHGVVGICSGGGQGDALLVEAP